MTVVPLPRIALSLLCCVSLLGACGRGRNVEDASDLADQPAPTRLDCPEGTTEIGALPPDGYELWCGRTTDAGVLEHHGPVRTFWPDGKPKEVGFFDGARRAGHWWFWSAQGSIEREGGYAEGRETGYWLHYRPDGSVAEEGPMVDGERQGFWTMHAQDSGVSSHGLWLDGEKEGVWVEYNDDGRPTREREFRRGRQISQREL